MGTWTKTVQVKNNFAGKLHGSAVSAMYPDCTSIYCRFADRPAVGREYRCLCSSISKESIHEIKLEETRTSTCAGFDKPHDTRLPRSVGSPRLNCSACPLRLQNRRGLRRRLGRAYLLQSVGEWPPVVDSAWRAGRVA